MQNGAINFTNYSLLEAPQNQDFTVHLLKYVENLLLTLAAAAAAAAKKKKKTYWNLKKKLISV